MELSLLPVCKRENGRGSRKLTGVSKIGREEGRKESRKKKTGGGKKSGKKKDRRRGKDRRRRLLMAGKKGEAHTSISERLGRQHMA